MSQTCVGGAPVMAPTITVHAPEMTNAERLRLVEIAFRTTDNRLKEQALRVLEASWPVMLRGLQGDAARDWGRRAQEQQGAVGVNVARNAGATVDPPEGVRPVPRNEDRANVGAMVRGHAPDLEPDGLAPRGG